MRILSNGEWVRLKAALDAARSGTGRPFPDQRWTVEAVVWRQRNGAKWRSAPPELGPWWKAARLHIRWSRMGVWARAFAWLRSRGRPQAGRGVPRRRERARVWIGAESGPVPIRG